MDKNMFNDISPQKENRDIKKPEKLLTRREVISGLIASSALFMIGKSTLTKKDSNLQTSENNFKKNEDHQNNSTEEQRNIETNDTDIIGKTFLQQLKEKDHITLDEATRKAIYNHHHKEYSPDGPNYEKGLLLGLERMQPWIDEIRAIFTKYNVPENFIYLAIAESHFDVNAISGAGAVGPYQITKSTARLPQFHITVTDTYDERRDPIKSAELCAKHLQYSWNKFEHDWSFALMDYNGGLTNKYIEHKKRQEQTSEITIETTHILQKNETLSDLAQKYNTSITLLKRANNFSDEDVRKLSIKSKIKIPQERLISLDDFNEWLEKHINTIIARESQNNLHIVKSGDTLSALAIKYNTTTQTLQEMNELVDDQIKINQKLKIPFDKKIREDKIIQALSKFKENINYPEKLYAILDVIEKEGLTTKFNTSEITYTEIRAPKINITHFSHTVRRGETLEIIAKQFKTKYPECTYSATTLTQLFVRANKLKNKHTIFENQTLILNIPLKRPPSLIDIASQNDIDIEKLKTLNPAVLDVSAELPKNITIRIPKK